MSQDRQGSRFGWLMLGLVAGIGIASFWPHEPLRAMSSDRNQKFAMMTTPVGNGNEGVFVLDFLTGRLVGACLGKAQGGVTQFQYFYFRNVAEDFQAAGQGETYYSISGGQVAIGPNSKAIGSLGVLIEGNVHGNVSNP